MADRQKSRYATKRDRGDQMYGPGCCAHGITDAQMRAAREKARIRREAERDLPFQGDPIMERMRNIHFSI